jgi:hypothetical protein
VVLTPPATEEIGAMGREIESRHGIHRIVGFEAKKIFLIINVYLLEAVLTFTFIATSLML